MNLALFKYSVLLTIKKKESHLLYILLPYSPFTEIRRRLMDRERFNLLEKIFILPILLIALLPIYFGIISIKYVCVHYWSTLIGKISVVFSIWMFIIIALLFISKIIISNKRESFKTGKTDSILMEASDNPAPDQHQM
jgi:cell division protein FtsL